MHTLYVKNGNNIKTLSIYLKVIFLKKAPHKNQMNNKFHLRKT